MAIITTPAMIGAIVTYIGTKLSKNESISDFVNGFTEATLSWIKPLFLKEDGSLQKELEKLKEMPSSKIKQDAIKTMLESELEDKPEVASYIKEIFENLSKTEEGGKIVNTITNSKNVVTGNIHAGGNVNIGDSGMSQHHSGSGDNVGGNKIVNNGEGSVLNTKSLKGKEGISIEAEQKKSTANFEDFDTDGEIKINIKQE